MMISKRMYYIISSILFTLCIVITFRLNSKAQEIQQEIAGEVIRFHILANSDSEEDQQLKLAVKEDVIDYLQEILNEMENIDETRAEIIARLGEIESKAAESIAAHGYQYDVRVRLDKAYFPVKHYGDVTLPKGDYEALIIEIGEAKGANWWCVVFPQLCFVDATYGYVPEPSKEQLKNVLTEDAYDSIIDNENVEVRFKLLDVITGNQE